MDICVIGTGYVGLVLGTCLSDIGHYVTCVDIDESKISLLKNGQVPIYEPDLEELIRKNVDNGKLQFSTSIQEGLKGKLFSFIAVGTPQGEDGSADLTHVLSVAKQIGKYIDDYTIVIDKSTVPIGTAAKVKEVIAEQLRKRGIAISFDVVSNPEFLREGSAIKDFMEPDRIVIGTDNIRTGVLMKELYRPITEQGYPLFSMSIPSAELTKYANNAMLATRISFMNEIAGLCEATGANIEEVKIGVGSDKRIGGAFLNAGLGYGGSCFPKDVKAIIKTGSEYQIDLQILKAVENVNKRQKKKLLDKVVAYYGENLSGRKFAVWGLAFKPETDDMREAPSIETIKGLIQRGAIVYAHDPVAMENAKRILGTEKIIYVDDPYQALQDVDGLLIITEWTQYKNIDLNKMKELMKTPAIFDGRNLFDPAAMSNAGFLYSSIGRNDAL